ncbi:hypothetical protein DPEC_G00304480 [Dallia pectoralis]|uniref:Uncharacterized protein n=1 Tax=Dallia pectoralis TaxID=75939 RepID=A0ACC2FDP0_DALPE|nr:hypothetical protein DPEC_G00304480 [Dallia pectoralis]
MAPGAPGSILFSRSDATVAIGYPCVPVCRMQMLPVNFNQSGLRNAGALELRQVYDSENLLGAPTPCLTCGCPVILERCVTVGAAGLVVSECCSRGTGAQQWVVMSCFSLPLPPACFRLLLTQLPTHLPAQLDGSGEVENRSCKRKET